MAEREIKKKRQCAKCKITMIENVNFYNTKRLDLYPDGIVDECRKCFTMHVNIHEPSTFVGLLEKLDMPYIEGEWKRLVEKYGDESTATALFGRYISKMKLNQFKDKGFADTEKYVAEQEMRQLREKAEKLDKINKYRMAQETGSAVAALEEIDINSLTKEEKESLFLSPEDLLEDDDEDTSSLAIDDDLDSLTKDDKKYLIQKWGRTYTIPECIKLEKLYIEMIESYDIRTASHFDYLLKICRVSLKIDQALEVNDIDGFQKMTKIYDLLMKSAKFTAAQNKETAEDYTDSVGVLVGMCEQEGFVPVFHNNERQDVVDFTLRDMNNYNRDLVMNEMNLGNMIEVYLQKMKAEEEKEEDEMTEDEDEDLVFVEKNEEMLIEDSDYEDFNDMISEEEYEDSIKEGMEAT